jgi:hypothetical protein
MRTPRVSLFLLVCLCLVVVSCALTTLGQATVSDEFRRNQPVGRAVYGAAYPYQLKPALNNAASAAIQQNQDSQTASQLDEDALRLFHRSEKEAITEAVEKWRQAAALWQKLGDRQREGQMLNRTGRALYVLSEYRFQSGGAGLSR